MTGPRRPKTASTGELREQQGKHIDEAHEQPRMQGAEMKRRVLGIASWLAAWGLAAGAAEMRVAEDFDATWQEGRWAFSNGAEFPGARGSFGRARDAAHGGQWGGRLRFDFSGGGNYVAAILRLDGAPDVAAVRLWVKKPRGHRLTFRYTDPTGQTLQKGFMARDGKWTDAFIAVGGWTGSWGGANDGVVHGPPRQIAILAENTARPHGELLFDDVRLIVGKPGKGAGMVTSEIVAARFAADEGWGCRGGGALAGRTWRFDFAAGAPSVGIAPRDASLLGEPQEFRIRVRGAAPGHPVRLQLATHFMTFEKTIGEFAGDGESEIVVPAPPSEGWRWFGGENDGKLHGPLRIRGIFLDAAGRKDAGQLELVDIRVKTSCAPHRCCVLMAERRRTAQGAAFVALARNLAPKPIEATIAHTVRDWKGRVLIQGAVKATVPANGQPVETSVALPAGDHRFLEATFEIEAEGQQVPAAQACHVAPIEPHGSAEPDPASPFGMGLYLYRYSRHPASLAEMDRAARMARDAGVKWSREEFSWARIQPKKGEFDWSFYDAMVATAKRHGISVYGLLSYWSAWTKPYTPEGIADYCRFAAAAVDRYRGDIVHWEVWNEPNIFFWQGPRDLYAELLTEAHAAIRKANPKALVLGCSTAGIDLGFIRRTIELGAPFDVLTIHPYREHLDDRRFIAELKEAADVARRPDGTLRQVWITEMGWATHVPHNASSLGFRVTTQRHQAQLLARAYIGAVASGVAPNISWYDFRNDGTDPFNFEHNLGIVTRDFEPKPAYRAFATVTRLLKGTRADGELDLGPDIVAFRFLGKGGEAVIALWCTGDDRQAAVPASRPATLVDLMGNEETLEPADGSAGVALQSETPVFLVVPGAP